MKEMTIDEVVDADFKDFLIKDEFIHDKTIHLTDARMAMGLAYSSIKWMLKKSHILGKKLR